MALYLVTGGAGFIGSHLCDALLERGDTVRVLDDLSTGKLENLPDGVELIVGDVVDAAATRRAVDGIAGCFHLAAIASVDRGINDWLGTHRTNLTGTITLFDAIRRLPDKPPVVYASSAAVYGDGNQTRDFVFVADVVTALLAAMRPHAKQSVVYNVCTGIATIVLALAHSIADLAGTRLDVRHRPPRTGEICHSTGSPTASRAALDLPEPTPLHDGLGSVLDWPGRSG